MPSTFRVGALPHIGTLVTPLVALALLGGSAGAQTPERHVLRGDKLAIYNLVGSIRLEGAVDAGGATTVEVTKRGSDGARLRVETGELRGRETLRVIYPERRITFAGSRGGIGRWFDRERIEVHDDGTFGTSTGRGWSDRNIYEISSRSGGFEGFADVVVRVPAGRSVEIHLAAGEAAVARVDGDVVVDVHAATVTTSGTKGRLTLDTGAGAVRVTDAAGTVLIDSGSGDVDLTRVSGDDLTIDSGSGAVTGSDISVADLNVDSGSGSIKLRNVTCKDIMIDSGSGSVELDLAGDVDHLQADTGSGRFVLHVPESLGAEVTIESGRRGLDVDFPMTITRRNEDYVRGTIGDGKGEIRIDTGSGGVRLRRRG
jgi:lia operon protein LiaG